MPQTLNNTLKWNGVSDYVTVTAASAQTVVISANCQEIRICSNTNCHVNIGTNPTAAATDNNGFYLPANISLPLHVAPGQRLAVIRDTADGVFCMMEMTR